MNDGLVAVLRAPQSARDLQLEHWDVLIPQARNTGLLASLGLLFEEHGLLESVPSEVQRHIVSGMHAHRKQRENLDYELKWLRRALAEIGEPVILLKGAAYAAAGLKAGRGRLMSDIDLLVPAPRIPDAEAVLNRYDWRSGQLDPYDERYYRQWMHEIPPLGHLHRGSTLDVHHTILPPTARQRVDAGKLFANVTEAGRGIFVLGRSDMVLHSATHLFHEGEFSRGLRDLWDLDQLMRQFAAEDAGFWEALAERARELDLVDLLHYGFRYARLYFGTPVPDAVLRRCADSRRPLTPLPVMDFIFRRAFVPDHPSCRLPGTAIARECLYIRSHYLRMPLHLLLPHLARKAWMGVTRRTSASSE